MKSDIVIALDVGGTFTKGCVIENGIILEDSVKQFDSYSNKSAEIILQHFVEIINELYKNFTHNTDKNGIEKRHIGIGMAFPGPFDYEKGISYIKGLNKFESLYNYNVHDELINRLKSSHLAKDVDSIQVLSENDGRLFGLGASTIFPEERLICLTIGTGLGSVFIHHGKIVKNGISVPPEGFLYNQPFKTKTIDDHFSRRGILNLAAEHGLQDSHIDVKELAELAHKGNEKAQAVFHEFGHDLATMLQKYVESFQPDRVVIGGQIAKSFDLFSPELSKLNTTVSSLDHALRHTFLGINQLFQ